jgi:UDP-N-acetylglucosamine 2-epimerase (non-hydrolysing)
LTEFLHEGSLVDARSVAVAASALEAEIDDGAIAEEPAPAPAPPAEFARIGQGVLVLVANGRSDHVKAISLLASFAECEGLPPAVVVSTSDAEVWMLNRGLLEGERFVHLAIARATDAVPALDHIGRRFAQMVEQCRPCAVVLFDGNAVSQMCASIAHERQVPLVHIGAQAQSTEELFDPVNCRTAISQFADLRFDCQPPSIGGLPPQALQSFAVGNLLIDSVRFTVQKALQQARPIGPSNPFADAVDDRVGYGVVVLRQWSEVSGWAGREELVAMLRAVSRDLPLIWPMRRSNLPMKANAAAPAAARNTRGKGRLKEKVKTGLVEALDGYRVVCIEELSYLEFIDLLLDATCVLTDSPDVIEEAAALQLPCLSFGECHVGQHGDAQWLGALQVGLSATRATRAVWQILFSGLEEAALPAEWDGHAGARIANRLAQWLAQRRGVMHGVADETSTPPI